MEKYVTITPKYINDKPVVVATKKIGEISPDDIQDVVMETYDHGYYGLVIKCFNDDGIGRIEEMISGTIA